MRTFEDSRKLPLVCRQLFHETSSYIGSYVHLTVKTPGPNMWGGGDDIFVSIARMLPQKKCKSLKSVSLYSRTFHDPYVYIL
jgi:hypothetical protein